ncbi:MAG: hypothetical protein IJO03_05745 [Clostridia bacterium]|nr:hypothetical protein [Clostridia bacterium]
MAKIEAELRGNFKQILSEIEDAVLGRSVSASLEDSSNIVSGDTRCAVRVYERYSYTGGNRVSMNITLLDAGGRIFVTAITSGGSQAMLFKINTFGEESFLETVTDVIEQYRV